MAFLANGTFEKGTDGWSPINGAPLVTMQVVSDGTARSGSKFLRVRVDQPDCSVGTDFWTKTGDYYVENFSFAATASIGALAYIRSAPGSPLIHGSFKLWSLGQEGKPINDNATRFSVGNEWQLIMCVLDDANKGAGRVPKVRVEFYVATVNAFFDIDSVWVS